MMFLMFLSQELLIWCHKTLTAFLARRRAAPADPEVPEETLNDFDTDGDDDSEGGPDIGGGPRGGGGLGHDDTTSGPDTSDDDDPPGDVAQDPAVVVPGPQVGGGELPRRGRSRTAEVRLNYFRL